jgi:CRP/FNR family transcriptional regulator
MNAVRPMGGETHGCAVACEVCDVRLVAVCAALEKDELGRLAALAQHVHMGGRAMLFHETDTAHSVYTMTSGTVRLYKDLSDGRRQVVGFALPGDFLGLALSDRFGFSAETLVDTTACRFDRRRFEVMVADKPHLLRRLHGFAAHELSLAQEQMVLLGRRRADERLACFLTRWRQRLSRLRPDSATVPLPMGRQDIADYLGLTIETVSRTFSKFVKERVLINVPDGVRVLDNSRLAEMSSN